MSVSGLDFRGRPHTGVVGGNLAVYHSEWVISGDGSTDNTVALSEGIYAFRNNGGVIVLDGECRVNFEQVQWPGMTSNGAGALVGLTGARTGSEQVQAKIIGSGVSGTATFQYSLDGGASWSSTHTTATNYPVPTTSLTLHFDDSASYTATTVYTFLAAGMAGISQGPITTVYGNGINRQITVKIRGRLTLLSAYGPLPMVFRVTWVGEAGHDVTGTNAAHHAPIVPQSFDPTLYCSTASIGASSAYGWAVKAWGVIAGSYVLDQATKDWLDASVGQNITITSSTLNTNNGSWLVAGWDVDRTLGGDASGVQLTLIRTNGTTWNIGDTAGVWTLNGKNGNALAIGGNIAPQAKVFLVTGFSGLTAKHAKGTYLGLTGTAQVGSFDMREGVVGHRIVGINAAGTGVYCLNNHIMQNSPNWVEPTFPDANNGNIQACIMMPTIRAFGGSGKIHGLSVVSEGVGILMENAGATVFEDFFFSGQSSATWGTSRFNVPVIVDSCYEWVGRRLDLLSNVSIFPLQASAASVSSKTGNIATITGLSGVTSTHLGGDFAMSGAASSGNNGTFPIVAIVSSTSVKIANANAVAGDANNGALNWAVGLPYPSANIWMTTSISASNSFNGYAVLDNVRARGGGIVRNKLLVGLPSNGPILDGPMRMRDYFSEGQSSPMLAFDCRGAVYSNIRVDNWDFADIIGYTGILASTDPAIPNSVWDVALTSNTYGGGAMVSPNLRLGIRGLKVDVELPYDLYNGYDFGSPPNFSDFRDGRLDVSLTGEGAHLGPVTVPDWVEWLPINADPTTWSSLVTSAGAGCTFAMAMGPAGKTTSARIHAPSPSVFHFDIATGSAASNWSVGDQVIVGFWLKCVTATAYPDNNSNFSLIHAGFGFNNIDPSVTAALTIRDKQGWRVGGEWKLFTTVGRVTAVSGSHADFSFIVAFDGSTDVIVDKPFAIRIPASASVPEAEIYRLARHVRRFNHGAPAGRATLGSEQDFGWTDTSLFRSNAGEVKTTGKLTAGNASLSGSAVSVSGLQVVTNQQPSVRNSTGAGDVVAQLNALISAMQTHGLIALDPRNIGNLWQWLRADLGVTGSSTISSWADQSGSGSGTTVTAAGAARPSLNSSDAGYNGQPTISFASGQFLVGAYGSTLSQPATIYVVGESSTGGEYYDSNDLAGANRMALANLSGAANIYAGSLLNSAVSCGSKSAVGATFNGASSNIFVNAVTPQVTGAAGAQTSGGLSVGAYPGGGGSSFLIGKVAELLVFAAVHSAAQRSLVMTYLGNRYSIPIGS